MKRRDRFYPSELLLCIFLCLSCASSFADNNPSTETSDLTGVILVSVSFLLVLSGIFLVCLKKLIQERNTLNESFKKLRENNDDLLTQKHQWQETESKIINTNVELEKRLNARTETVNKVNHELTKTLERLHQQDQSLNSLITAVESSHSKILIIDKHYRVCFASRMFLQFSGLYISDIKDQPLKRLEKHICLPEMASNGLTLNKDGLIDTQLKCLDRQGISHWLDARIALSWSDLKEIIHYVIIFDEQEQTSV
jgi:PAS domain-containing protein